MGILDAIGTWMKAPTRVADYFGLGEQLAKQGPSRMAYAMREWLLSPPFGQPRNINLFQVRNFAKSVWVRMCVDTLIDEATAIEWKIVPIDNSKNVDAKTQKQIDACTDFYNNPNRNKDSLLSLHKAVLRDVLEIDAGVIYKTFSADSFEDEKPEIPKANREYRGTVPLAGSVKAKSFDPAVVKATSPAYTYQDNYYDVNAELDDKRFAEVKTRMPVLKKFGKRKLLEIWARDGGTFLKNVDRHGIECGFFQYGLFRNLAKPLPFANEEICYISENPRTDSVYGYSKVQTVMEILETLNWSVIHNRDLLRFGALPDAIGVLKGAGPDGIKKWKRLWDQEYRGKPHKIAWTDNEVDIHALTLKNAEMEWLDSQKWYSTIVMATFKVPPNELGFTEKSNKASAETQERKMVRAALKPTLNLLAYFHSTEIIPEILQEPPLVKFEFQAVDVWEDARIRANDKMDLELGVRTINEVRADRGLEPVEWGEEPFSQFGFGGGGDEEQDGSGTSEESTDEFKTYKLKNGNRNMEIEMHSETKSREKIRTHASLYTEYIERELERLEQRIQDAIPTLTEKESKSFGDFLVRLFSATFTQRFYNEVARLVKLEFSAAVEKTERETGVQVGMDDKALAQVNQLVTEQLQGYKLPDGGVWKGIVGTTREIRETIGKEIVEGMNAKEGVGQLADRVSSVFDVEKSRAVNIARTESIRIANAGLDEGYRQSGVPGTKVWVSKNDDRTSDVCIRMDGQEVSIGAKFVDPGTGAEYDHPPGHPQCRSRIIFRPSKS